MHKEKIFKAGDKVYIRMHTEGQKKPTKYGPYKIVVKVTHEYSDKSIGTYYNLQAIGFDKKVFSVPIEKEIPGYWLEKA